MGVKIIHCIGVTIRLKWITISYKLVKMDYIFTIEGYRLVKID